MPLREVAHRGLSDGVSHCERLLDVHLVGRQNPTAQHKQTYEQLYLFAYRCFAKVDLNDMTRATNVFAPGCS
eukprot:10607057-Heterocapsa_arctica.AAC.1